MKIRNVAVAALGLAIVAVAPAAFAGAKDYEFQPVAADVKNGAGSDVAVRIVHKLTGKPRRRGGIVPHPPRYVAGQHGRDDGEAHGHGFE
jgi:hypothetical protein